MKCEKCGEIIKDNMVYEFKDKKVCDDCYIDLLIGTPDVDISKLAPEVQAGFHRVMQSWHRDRPNRHHYLKYPSLDDKETGPEIDEK
jgi:hypothetical protein